MPRIFVAVRLPATAAAAVEQTQEGLRQRAHDVKWVETENLHLTLRFFGEIDEDDLRSSIEVVQTVTRSVTPFTIELAGVGCFPPAGRPRVIWVGMRSGGERLVQLAGQLDVAFGEAGLGRERRPFRPHLTIGRLRGPDRRRGQRRRKQRFGPAPPLQAVPEIQAALTAARCGPLPVTVAEVAVVESILRPAGPVYEDRAVGRLGATPR